MVLHRLCRRLSPSRPLLRLCNQLRIATPASAWRGRRRGKGLKPRLPPWLKKSVSSWAFTNCSLAAFACSSTRSSRNGVQDGMTPERVATKRPLLLLQRCPQLQRLRAHPPSLLLKAASELARPSSWSTSGLLSEPRPQQPRDPSWLRKCRPRPLRLCAPLQQQLWQPRHRRRRLPRWAS